MQELRRRSFELAIRTFQPDETARSSALRAGLDLIQLLPGQAPSARHPYTPNAAALTDRRRRDRELRFSKTIGRIEELELVAEIGPVRSVALHRLGVRHLLERSRHRDTNLTPQRSQQAFGQRYDIALRDERRLDVYLRELRLAVNSQVLIPEAARDLEIAIEARDHEQLLVQLRRLRQRVEFARVNAARDQIVARAFRRRLGENRRLDLEEA